MAKKKATKRSTSSRKKKTGAKSLKARRPKAKTPAKVRGGETPSAPPSMGSKEPGLTSFSNP